MKTLISTLIVVTALLSVATPIAAAPPAQGPGGTVRVPRNVAPLGTQCLNDNPVSRDPYGPECELLVGKISDISSSDVGNAISKTMGKFYRIPSSFQFYQEGNPQRRTVRVPLILGYPSPTIEFMPEFAFYSPNVGWVIQGHFFDPKAVVLMGRYRILSFDDLLKDATYLSAFKAALESITNKKIENLQLARVRIAGLSYQQWAITIGMAVVLVVTFPEGEVTMPAWASAVAAGGLIILGGSPGIMPETAPPTPVSPQQDDPPPAQDCWIFCW